ncbi:putative ACR, COG1399 [Prevotella disiens FB035-09AN]|uniref:Putative ACR, COG1399 n=1 Tax=Prevotella disiens FB035-09AN TaxID=866771 RepID=E1KRD5_9BACT|nr:DUF177 domain-containing protein [Prevotella disiens]EFL45918.1 putative ACR, COG1399 [Prevotella disiens FB035-09AN]
MDLDNLKIDLKGLSDGLNSFAFDLDDAYFKAIDVPEVSRGSVHVELDIVRHTDDDFTLTFKEKGMVIVPCDICLEDMEQEIETEQQLNAKFGNENSEEDDLVTVAENEGMLDVSWYVYEFILLALPIKHVHAPGKCNPAMIRMLEEHSAARSGSEDEKPIDSRWEALLKLKK